MNCPICTANASKPFPSTPELCEKHRLVMQVDFGVVGEVKHVHPPGEYRADDETQPIPEPVVSLDTGDAFLLVPNAFAPVSAYQVAVYRLIRNGMGYLERAALKMIDPNFAPLEEHEGMREMILPAFNAELRAIKQRLSSHR